ncbi:MAG: carboxypeptidase regulatory-like domain-containing protein, partial [Nannocystaceae bacterium]|nr:carboxypeptidase regulatory-like domain-containing protein [Nannocystaceae bacterium]
MAAVLTALGAPYQGEAIAAPAQTKSATSSALTGIVRDKHGKALAGVTVVLDCLCMQDVRVTDTNANGLYRFKVLPSGHFTVQAVHNNVRKVLEVKLGRGDTRRLSIVVKGGGSRRTVVVKGPAVRSASGETGVEFTGDELDLIAAGGTDRNAVSGAIAQTVTGGKDAGGDTTGGATSGEMNYVLDGLRSNGIGNGMATLDTVNEFV